MPSKPGSKERNYGYKPKEKATPSRGRLRIYYNSHRWRKERKAFIQSHPLCEECKRNGKITSGEVVDHIIPHPIVNFWKQSNWQTLCQSCNLSKGGQDAKMLREYEQKGTKRVGTQESRQNEKIPTELLGKKGRAINRNSR